MNRKWQSELRRKLEREAFNEKYSCFICGGKDNLHIHHLIYSEDKEGYFDPRFWRMLCKSCHAIIPSENKRGRKKQMPKERNGIKSMEKIMSRRFVKKEEDFLKLFYLDKQIKKFEKEAGISK